MYSFQFIHESNEDNSIFLFAEDSNQAVIKIKQIKIPDFKLKEWVLREIIEIDNTVDFELET